VVKALLGSGADIHKRLYNDYTVRCTVLMIAVDCDHLAVVEALLEAGADAKVMGDDGVTALSIAMHGKKAAIVAALQRHSSWQCFWVRLWICIRQGMRRG
jgi:hypothetical protein